MGHHYDLMVEVGEDPGLPISSAYASVVEEDVLDDEKPVDIVLSASLSQCLIAIAREYIYEIALSWVSIIRVRTPLRTKSKFST